MNLSMVKFSLWHHSSSPQTQETNFRLYLLRGGWIYGIIQWKQKLKQRNNKQRNLLGGEVQLI